MNLMEQVERTCSNSRPRILRKDLDSHAQKRRELGLLDCRGPNIECVRAIFVGDGVDCTLRDDGLAGVFEPEGAAEPKRNGGSCEGLGVGATVEGFMGEVGGAAVGGAAEDCGAVLESGAFAFGSVGGRVVP